MRQAEHPLPADILLVDDTPENLRLLSQALGERGYGVRAVTSAFAGAMADDASLRAEMWAAIGGGVRGAAAEPA